MVLLGSGWFGVGLGSVWGRCGVGLGSVWGWFGVGLGSVWVGKHVKTMVFLCFPGRPWSTMVRVRAWAPAVHEMSFCARRVSLGPGARQVDGRTVTLSGHGLEGIIPLARRTGSSCLWRGGGVCRNLVRLIPRTCSVASPFL